MALQGSLSIPDSLGQTQSVLIRGEALFQELNPNGITEGVSLFLTAWGRLKVS